MKESLEHAVVDPEMGRVRQGTDFRSDYVKVTFYVSKIVVPLLDPEESETRWSMDVEWYPLIPTYHNDTQRAKVQALNTFMGCHDNRYSMRLSEENIPFMHGKLNQVIDAELCAVCHFNIVPKGHIECYSCVMECQHKDDHKHLCGVCKEYCLAKMDSTPCCKQHIHRVCRTKWDGDCPFCRAPWID